MKLVEKISRKFSKHEKQYDSNYEEPVIRCSICTGEQVAGFLNLSTGKFEEVMLIRTSQDLENFQNEYDVRKENRPCKRDGEGRLAIKTIKPSL